MIAGCGRQTAQRAASQETVPPPPPPEVASDVANAPDACAMVLASQAGDSRTDRQIARMQENVRSGKNALQSLENLGWLYVAKARESFDPGYYKLAEQCAYCLESREPHSLEALLLRGHVLQNLHRFKDAEPLARELVERRGLSFDYGLLGDVLMEQGRLDEAADAYQKMVDQKPDLQAYARISHLRWLKGDTEGAIEVMKLATSAASPNSPEPAAWVNTQLALLEFQRGNFAEANQVCNVALDYQHEYAPALLLRGQILMAQGESSEAVEMLQRAVQLNPLPNYQWVLSEALRAASREDEAAAVEATLRQQGAATDPRTFSLYLASHDESPAAAVELARAELDTRADVFTHDALAWSLAASGQIEEARSEMKLALSQGTKDARLFLHAGVIAAKAGDEEEANLWLGKAAPMMALLLPSERKQWQAATVQLGQVDALPAENDSEAADTFTPAN